MGDMVDKACGSCKKIGNRYVRGLQLLALALKWPDWILRPYNADESVVTEPMYLQVSR